MALFLTFPHEKTTFQWSKVVSEATNLCACIQKVTNFLGPEDRIFNLHIRNPHIKSDKLAKTQSLVIFVEQKLSSSPMCIVMMI